MGVWSGVLWNWQLSFAGELPVLALVSSDEWGLCNKS